MAWYGVELLCRLVAPLHLLNETIHTAFAAVQDPLDYLSHTWHSQVDTVDHVSKDNLIQNAKVMAAMTWAMLNGKKLPHVAPQVLR